MLSDFSFVELVLYGLVWIVIGALPGFYIFTASDRNPRSGSTIGGLIGAVIGIVIGISEDITSVQEMANVVLVIIVLSPFIAIGMRFFAPGNHGAQVTLQQRTADLAYGLILPMFVLVMAIVVFPMIWNMVLAFRPVRTGDLANLSIFSLENLTMGNFERIFRRSDRFFDTFFPALLDTVIMLAILAAGWFGGRYAGRRQNRVGNDFVWIGFFIGVVVVALFAGARDYGDAIGTMLSGREFLNTLFRTLVYTLTGTILAIVLGIVAALLVKDEFRGRNIVRGFMLFPYIAPIVSVVFVWKLLLNAQFGLVNEVIDNAGGQRVDFLFESGTAFLMIVLFQGWRYFPFAFLFILARIQAIPEDMYEAAKVDGAAPSQRLWFITLPQLRAVFGTLFVLRFIWTFNKFDDVFLLTGGAANTQLVTIEIFDQLFSRSNIGMASAVALVLAAVLIVVVGIYFKWFMVEDE